VGSNVAYQVSYSSTLRVRCHLALLAEQLSQAGSDCVQTELVLWAALQVVEVVKGTQL
jgi:hypothetical protein